MSRMGEASWLGRMEGIEGQEPSSDGTPTAVLQGKYRVLTQLGQGGTANVMLAVAHGPAGFNKLVVLKSMKGALRDEPDLPRMFMNEARLAARLNHPNIVQTNEVFEADGLPTIVMEYLEGQTLASIMGRARGSYRFPLPMRLRVISEVLAGLHHSHELTDFDGTPLSVVHRDVSPHNVFVTFEGQVKLLDFGIAKLSGSHIETATGVMKGKLRYMSPEQIAGEGIDRRSDVFACGIMLWEATTDARMWDGLHDATIMNRILNGEIPPPHTLSPHIDKELEAIVMKALAPSTADRYPTAEALQKALDDYLDGLGAHVRDREIGDAVAALFSDERNETRQLIEERLAQVKHIEVSQSKRVEKQTAMVWIALIAALAAIAIAGFSIMRERMQPEANVQPSVPANAPSAPSAQPSTHANAPVTPSATLVLEPAAPAPAAASPSPPPSSGASQRKQAQGKRPPKSQAVARPAAPAPCDPPYSVDSRGIKKFKPECL